MQQPSLAHIAAGRIQQQQCKVALLLSPCPQAITRPCRGLRCCPSRMVSLHALVLPSVRPEQGSCWSKAGATAAAARNSSPLEQFPATLRTCEPLQITLYACFVCRPAQEPSGQFVGRHARPEHARSAEPCSQNPPSRCMAACISPLLSAQLRMGKGAQSAGSPSPATWTSCALDPSHSPFLMLHRKYCHNIGTKAVGPQQAPGNPGSSAPGDTAGCNCACSHQKQGLQGWQVRAAAGFSRAGSSCGALPTQAQSVQ